MVQFLSTSGVHKEQLSMAAILLPKILIPDQKSEASDKQLIKKNNTFKIVK